VLIEIASDPESAEDLRGMAVLVFQHMENKLNEEQKKGLDDLIMRLNDDQQPITLRTAAAMDLITDEDEEKNAKFLRVIFAGVADSKLPRMRADAASKIGKFKPDGGVPILIEALADPDRDVVWWACNSLGYYKTTAADAVPELVKLIKTHEDSPSTY